MKFLYTIIALFIIGVAGVMYYNYYNQPVLESKSINYKTLKTTLYVYNAGNKDIKIEKFEFQALKFKGYNPPQGWVAEESGNDVIFVYNLRTNKESKEHAWMVQRTIIVTPDESYRIQLRIYDPDYPGEQAHGILKIYYNGGKCLEITGVVIDIQSWPL